MPTALVAQLPRADGAAEARVAMDAGIGAVATSPGGLAGYKLSLSVALPRGRALIVRYVNVQELCVFDPCLAPGRAYEAGALYGWTEHTRYAGTTAAAGIGVLSTLTENRSSTGIDRKRDTRPSIPIEVSGYVGSPSALALELAGAIDLAADHSFAGLFLGVRFGLD